MIKIKPFRAFIPKASYGGTVSTRQINSYSEEELQSIIDSNPDSFLNIILSERNNKSSSSEKFEKISSLFNESILNGLFVQSKEDSIYIYRQSNEEVSYTGIIAGASNENYQQDKIKKHEHTLAKREALFTKYLRITGFNAEPTLLIHSKNTDLEQIQSTVVESSPIHHFVSDDGLTHELWEISDMKTIEKILISFNKMECLYIADGHHRSASSSLLALESPEKESTQSVMALFMSEENITIHDYNRVVKNTDNISEIEILELLKNDFNFIENSENILEPKNKHEFCFYMNKKWNRIKLKKIVKQITIKKIPSILPIKNWLRLTGCESKVKSVLFSTSRFINCAPRNIDIIITDTFKTNIVKSIVILACSAKLSCAIAEATPNIKNETTSKAYKILSRKISLKVFFAIKKTELVIIARHIRISLN